jgi:hypothetical protein
MRAEDVEELKEGGQDVGKLGEGRLRWVWQRSTWKGGAEIVKGLFISF